MSAKIPKGWRVMRDGEIVKAGDGILSCNNVLHIITRNAPSIGWIAKSGGVFFIRRIRKARPHRFDGMTLANVLEKISDEWFCKSVTACSEYEYVAPRFAREVRRRDKMRDGK